MQKSGIDISKNSEEKRRAIVNQAPAPQRPVSVGANFVSGVEEDLNLAVDDAAAAADYEAQTEAQEVADLDELM